MDRIETPGLNGVLSRLKARTTAPVARAEHVRPTADDGPSAPEVALARTVGAGSEAPIDRERVSEIRRAVEEGRYPVVPTRIADAMIAAGFLLRSR